ncbi:MAG: PIN domain-containing protein [Treponema sp.]|nr:PIN domain-containing protein [Treponema sp.]
MKVLLDTNITIDILTKREPDYKASVACYEKIVLEGNKAVVSTISVADVMYITRKYFSNKEEQLKKVSDFIDTLKIAKVSAKDLKFAFSGVITDFEDALQAYCAKRYHVKYIITRNVKDYKFSPVKAITPEDFLGM